MKAEKEKEQKAKVAKLQSAKAKLQAVLDKSSKKAKPHKSISDRLKTIENQEKAKDLAK